jgi:hypothetical protein
LTIKESGSAPVLCMARAVIFVWKHGDYALVGWTGWTRGEKHEMGRDDVRRDGMGECDITDSRLPLFVDVGKRRVSP